MVQLTDHPSNERQQKLQLVSKENSLFQVALFHEWTSDPILYEELAATLLASFTVMYEESTAWAQATQRIKKRKSQNNFSDIHADDDHDMDDIRCLFANFESIVQNVCLNHAHAHAHHQDAV
jgi:hypothetical protein